MIATNAKTLSSLLLTIEHRDAKFLPGSITGFPSSYLGERPRERLYEFPRFERTDAAPDFPHGVPRSALRDPRNGSRLNSRGTPFSRSTGMLGRLVLAADCASLRRAPARCTDQSGGGGCRLYPPVPACARPRPCPPPPRNRPGRRQPRSIRVESGWPWLPCQSENCQNRSSAAATGLTNRLSSQGASSGT